MAIAMRKFSKILWGNMPDPLEPFLFLDCFQINTVEKHVLKSVKL